MLGILIGGLFTFFFGGLILILILGARRIEDELEQRQREAETVRARATYVPRFFVVTQPAPAQGVKLDEAILGRLQQYVEAEQILADEFVLQPSVDTLYRESGKKLVGH